MTDHSDDDAEEVSFPTGETGSDPLETTDLNFVQTSGGVGLGQSLTLDQGSIHSTTTPEERKRGVVVLFLSLTIVSMGLSSIFNILPALARVLGYAEWQTSAIFSVSAFFWVFASPYWGMKSDIWGRKTAILIGTGGYTVSTILFAFAAHAAEASIVSLSMGFFLMITARSIFGLFGSSTNPAANAYIADRTAPKERAAGLGLLAAAFGIGQILGPAMAGALSVFGLLVPIYFIAAMGGISGLLVWRYLPERTKPVQRKERVKLPLFDSRVLPFVIFGVALSLVQTIIGQTITYYFMDKLHIPPEVAPQYTFPAFTLMALGALFAQFVLIRNFGLKSRTLMRWGIGLAILTLIAFVIAPTFGALMFAMLLQGLAFGMARPGFSAAASLAVESHEQGAVAGLLGGTGGTGAILSPFIVYFVYQGISPEATYLMGAVLLAILFATLFWVPAFKVRRDH